MTHNDKANPLNCISVSPFHLEGCLVLPSLNRLQRGEETIQLEPRIMLVLVHLASRPGEVLSREYLFEAVWPDTVVCEEALTRTISELRRIFQDDPKSPHVIETIRKSGYRLLAPVAPVLESDLPPTRPVPSTIETPSSAMESTTTRANALPFSGESSQTHPQPLTEPFSIGEWLVEPELNRISANDSVVQLEPRVLQVLTCLASRPGKVVSRLSLLSTVWPDADIRETTLTSAISDLRRIFDDSPDKPRYIETIRGVGYRLVATIRSMGPLAETLSVDSHRCSVSPASSLLFSWPLPSGETWYPPIKPATGRSGR
jgi:DNA-binding winged helix-turn-helix (wHTH) protein